MPAYLKKHALNSRPALTFNRYNWDDRMAEGAPWISYTDSSEAFSTFNNWVKGEYSSVDERRMNLFIKWNPYDDTLDGFDKTWTNGLGNRPGRTPKNPYHKVAITALKDTFKTLTHEVGHTFSYEHYNNRCYLPGTGRRYSFMHHSSPQQDDSVWYGPLPCQNQEEVFVVFYQLAFGDHLKEWNHIDFRASISYNEDDNSLTIRNGGLGNGVSDFRDFINDGGERHLMLGWRGADYDSLSTLSSFFEDDEPLELALFTVVTKGGVHHLVPDDPLAHKFFNYHKSENTQNELRFFSYHRRIQEPIPQPPPQAPSPPSPPQETTTEETTTAETVEPEPVPVPTPVPQGNIKNINTGGRHTCAIKNNDEVLCWGDGSSGALGNNSNNNSLIPTAVVDNDGSSTPLGGIQSISAGSNHTCAIKTTGQVLCWGVGLRGELGNGAWNSTNYPVLVLGEDSDNDGAGNGNLSDIRQVSVGGYHTCAIKNTSGLILCWGVGAAGRLGNSENQGKAYPVPAKDSNGQNLTGMIQVSAGTYHTCAIKADRGVLCWGNPESGRLGHGSTTNNTLAPVTVVGIGGIGELSNITQISSGGIHTCALKADKSVVCWGGEDDTGGGVLGYGSSLASSSPVAVINEDGNGILTNITQVSTGDYHTCALAEDTRVLCWGGEGFGGALGHGKNTESTSPVYVQEGANSSNNFSGADQISNGAEHTCLTKNNQVFCWGRGRNGRLGQGNSENSNIPLIL